MNLLRKDSQMERRRRRRSRAKARLGNNCENPSQLAQEVEKRERSKLDRYIVVPDEGTSATDTCGSDHFTDFLDRDRFLWAIDEEESRGHW